MKKWFKGTIKRFIEEILVQKQIELEIETVEKDEKKELAKKIREIKDRHLPKGRRNRWFSITLLVAAPVAAGIAIPFVTITRNQSITDMVPALGFAAAIFFAALTSLLEYNAVIRTYEEQLKQAEDEFDLLEIAERDDAKRSEKLFRNHQRELKRYYDINLSHYRAMFPVGIVLVFLGAIIVGGTIWIFRDSSIAPILIGAVLIHMYTETVKSSIAFHSQLMKSNHALFANMLAFKIEDPTKHDETFAELAKLMIQSNVEPKK